MALFGTRLRNYARTNKENIPSRAYIAFKNESQPKIFHQEYNGHLFRDKAGEGPRARLGAVKNILLGNESAASVEAAPFQKVPSEKKKPDARAGTITEGKKESS